MPTDDEPEAVQITRPIEGITVITINRRGRRNAVNTATAQKLYSAFIAFEEDPAAKVAVFHGAHGTFCAGYDLHTVSESPTLAAAIPNLDSNDASRTPGPMGPSRLQVKKPVIAAVSGYAVAGGTELSLLGDMRVVEEDAHFGIFCRRWGIPLLDGGTVRLRAIVGLGRALDMILTGRPVGAQEALAMGLANRVVPKGKAFEAALAIAKELLRFPQACMRADRSSCYYACYQARSLEEALRFEFVNGLESLKGEGVGGAGRFSRGAGRHADFAKL